LHDTKSLFAYHQLDAMVLVYHGMSNVRHNHFRGITQKVRQKKETQPIGCASIPAARKLRGGKQFKGAF